MVWGSTVSSPTGVPGGAGAPAENEFRALYKAVRNSLVAIILNIPSTMFYNRAIKV